MRRSEPSKCLRSITITSSHRPRRLRSRTRYSLTTVNSPDRLDLTDRLPKQGSIDASTPMMLEMVAVGAIATQLELRMPWRCDARTQRVPVHRDGAVDLDIAAALLGQQVEAVDRQDAAVPQRAAVAGVAAALLGQLGRGPVGVVADRLHGPVGELDRRSPRRRAMRSW